MIVNLPDLLTGEDPGGTWAAGDCNMVNNNPEPVDITDPTMVDFTTSAPGTYTFAYTVAGGTCSSCAEVTVEVDETPVIDITPNPLDVCTVNGLNSFTLNTTVTNASDGLPFSGTLPLTYSWTEDAVALPDITPSITINNIAPGTYVYGVTVQTADSPPCIGTDTATVNVSPNLSAGLDNATTICEGETIDLTALLSGVIIPAGGTDSWLQTGGPAVDLTDPTMVTFPTQGTYTIVYQVDLIFGSLTCSDTATLTINVTSSPTAGTGSTTTVCN